MRPRKAAGPKRDKARGARRGDLLGRRIAAEATTSEARIQSVYSGQTCIGFLLPRGKQGTEAYDADWDSLGIFPSLKIAAAAVSAAAESRAQQPSVPNRSGRN